MNSYELNINFTKEDLETIYASGEKLVITKEVAGNKGKLVSWIVTLPFLKNCIRWTEAYMLYASRNEAQNGATIEKLSETEADSELLYDFNNAIFDNARSSEYIGVNEYGVCNQMDAYSYLTFGLAQEASVNGDTLEGRPINAVVLPYNHTATFSPIEKVNIFLANDIDNGMVITKEFSNTITVTYSGTENCHSIKYDSQRGIFVPVN